MIFKICLVFVALVATYEVSSLSPIWSLSQEDILNFLKTTADKNGKLVPNDLSSMVCSPCGKNRQQKCYHVVCYMKANWFGAVDHCNSLGMRLATIENDDQNREVALRINDNVCRNQTFWIGGSSIGDGSYTWISTGKPVIYQNFRYPNPTDCCISYRGGCWAGDDCRERQNFVCETILKDTCM